jgi:RNA polymerase sigma factor (sigma-70 family)
MISYMDTDKEKKNEVVQRIDDDLPVDYIDGTQESDYVLEETGQEREKGNDDISPPDDMMQDTDVLSIYLAECRKTSLLDAGQEKELARCIELGRELSDIQLNSQTGDGEKISSADTVILLLERMADNSLLIEKLCAFLDIPDYNTLSALCSDATLRETIDGAIEDSLVMRLTEAFGMNDDEVKRDIISLSVDSRLVPWAIVDEVYTFSSMADLKQTIYKDDFKAGIAQQITGLANHFDAIQNISREAANTLVQANLRLVVSIAKKHSAPSMTMSDFIQEGNIGLLKAAWKFSHRLGYRFSTYATWWIRQAMGRAITEQSRMIRLPGHMVDSIREVTRAQERFLNEHGYKPTKQELAEYTGISEKKLEQIIRAGSEQIVSLDTPIGEDGGQLADFIEDQSTPEPEKQAFNHMIWEQISDILESLTARERMVIEVRFGLVDDIDKTLEEVGRELGLTKERIRQIEKQALAKLRHPYNSKKLENCFI